jgi:ribA/ribD-fused uncharacterized protein
MSSAETCSSNDGEGASAALQSCNDYLTSGEMPSLRYSRAALGQQAQPMYMFWGHAEDNGKSFLSQWYPSPFSHHGMRYSCAEQWMMSEKARIFGDEETRALILAASGPKEMKNLGRQIKGFSEEQWLRYREMVVLKGTLLKFSQNPQLLASLLATEGILVEASPYDAVWGIGKASTPSCSTVCTVS